MESILAAGMLPVDVLIQQTAEDRDAPIDYENIRDERALFASWGMESEFEDDEEEE